MTLSAWDAVVIGAGAPGLMCAATAGVRGRSVLVLEHGARAGAKLLITGGGRFNFTNREISPEHYLSNNPRFCASALARLPDTSLDCGVVECDGGRWLYRANVSDRIETCQGCSTSGGDHERLRSAEQGLPVHAGH